MNAAAAPSPLTHDDIDAAFAGLERYDSIIAAVSGGADSTALMHLLSDWANRRGIDRRRLLIVTIDHGLRPDSAAEAATVAQAARALDLAHSVKTYGGETPAAFSQTWARDLRYRLLADTAAMTLAPDSQRRDSQRRAAILVAHHRDDQAETVLMRLARGSGIDGLGGMRRTRSLAGAVDLIRPLLDIPKARLVAHLQALGVPWIEDPSNANERFERVRLRADLPARDALGLTPLAMARVAQRAARASVALTILTDRLLKGPAIRVHELGYVTLDMNALRTEPDDLQLRALTAIIAAIGPAVRPSLSALEAFHAEAAASGLGGKTFGHCLFIAAGCRHVHVLREPGRTPPPGQNCQPGQTFNFDHRWIVTPARDLPPDAELRWLTAEGVRQAAAAGVLAPDAPREALRTLPALWSGQRLLSAPALGIEPHLLTVAPFRLLRELTRDQL